MRWFLYLVGGGVTVMIGGAIYLAYLILRGFTDFISIFPGKH